MKVQVTQENLSRALTSVGRIVGSRTSLPVLANLLLKTDNNRLKLAATNLEIGINHWIGAKIDKEGSLTVPARLLVEYISSLPPGKITIEADKNNLKISSEHTQSVINGIAASEFPSIPTVGKTKPVTLPAQDFKQALSQVVLAASVDDARPVLNGVFINSQKNKVFLVATDSYRLAEKRISVPAAAAQAVQLIIPARTMQELLRLIDEGTEQIELLVEDAQAMFRFGDVELISRLIEGQFPDYQQLIPKEAQTTITIDTAEFVSLAKVAGLFARENAGSVTLKINAKAKKLSIRSIASQVGENTSEASVKVAGSDAEVSLNCRYLLDGLSVVNAQQVTFAVTGKVNPCLLRPVDGDDYLHIIMPLRS